MSGKLSRTVLRRGKGSNPFSLVDYTNRQFKNKLDSVSAIQSMSRVSRCIDNGPMEGFWGIIKSEMYYLDKFHTYEELKQAIDKYMDFYNMRRLQKKLKGLTPIEYRNQTLAA
ncbi:transposase [Desulfosporosinus fructosivorans]